jgi:hypothetical protein
LYGDCNFKALAIKARSSGCGGHGEGVPVFDFDKTNDDRSWYGMDGRTVCEG